MLKLQFTDEEFNKILLKAQEFYSTIGHIRCLENGFRAWGGVVKTLNIDNRKDSS